MSYAIRFSKEAKQDLSEIKHRLSQFYPDTHGRYYWCGNSAERSSSMYQVNTRPVAPQKTMTMEEFLFHQSICRALDETRKKLQDPSARLLTREEFWQGVEEAIK